MLFKREIFLSAIQAGLSGLHALDVMPAFFRTELLFPVLEGNPACSAIYHLFTC
jgi:hypothetical protein